jgi:hypothetical protein
VKSRETAEGVLVDNVTAGLTILAVDHLGAAAGDRRVSMLCWVGKDR